MGKLIIVRYRDNPVTPAPDIELITIQNYYPFGMPMGDATLNIMGTDKYLLTGKELQTDLDLNTYDFGPRHYNPAIARWSNVDIMASSAPSFSPYVYSNNSPFTFTDPTGMVSENWILGKDGTIKWDDRVKGNSGYSNIRDFKDLDGYSDLGSEFKEEFKNIAKDGKILDEFGDPFMTGKALDGVKIKGERRNAQTDEAQGGGGGGFNMEIGVTLIEGGGAKTKFSKAIGAKLVIDQSNIDGLGVKYSYSNGFEKYDKNEKTIIGAGFGIGVAGVEYNLISSHYNKKHNIGVGFLGVFGAEINLNNKFKI